MKVRVLKPFICTKTKGRYDVGDIYNGDAETIASLANNGYVLARFAHVPKVEVVPPTKAEAHPFALLSHDPKTSPIIKPKRKRKGNESK